MLIWSLETYLNSTDGRGDAESRRSWLAKGPELRGEHLPSLWDVTAGGTDRQSHHSGSLRTLQKKQYKLFIKMAPWILYYAFCCVSGTRRNRFSSWGKTFKATICNYFACVKVQHQLCILWSFPSIFNVTLQMLAQARKTVCSLLVRCTYFQCLLKNKYRHCKQSSMKNEACITITYKQIPQPRACVCNTGRKSFLFSAFVKGMFYHWIVKEYIHWYLMKTSCRNIKRYCGNVNLLLWIEVPSFLVFCHTIQKMSSDQVEAVEVTRFVTISSTVTFCCVRSYIDHKLSPLTCM